MATAAKPRITVKEYLALERNSPDTKHEYFGGEIFAMAGASADHNLIVGNIIGELRNRLKGKPCRCYPSDLRVKIPATGLYTYPDAVVVCGTPEFEDAELDTLLNPTVVFEVLSPATEAYDRGKKSQNYRSLESLREYVLVWQDQIRAEHYVRRGDGQWLLTETGRREAVLNLESIGCTLPLAEVYDRVDLSQAPPA